MWFVDDWNRVGHFMKNYMHVSSCICLCCERKPCNWTVKQHSTKVRHRDSSNCFNLCAAGGWFYAQLWECSSVSHVTHPNLTQGKWHRCACEPRWNNTKAPFHWQTRHEWSIVLHGPNCKSIPPVLQQAAWEMNMSVNTSLLRGAQGKNSGKMALLPGWFCQCQV